MNYEKHYNLLITKAKARGWTRKTAGVYVEKHHIIPTSIGGDNQANNLVFLTAREHYVAHLLLYKIHGGQLVYAILNMMHLKNNLQDRSYHISSKLYAKLKEEAAKLTSQRMHTANKGKPKSPEHRQKIRIALQGKTNCHKGVQKTKEHKEKVIESRKNNGLVWTNDQTKQKISDAIKNLPKIECPHCKKLSSPANAKRWHLDNCSVRSPSAFVSF